MSDLSKADYVIITNARSGYVAPTIVISDGVSFVVDALVHGVPIVTDPFCPLGRSYMVDLLHV